MSKNKTLYDHAKQGRDDLYYLASFILGYDRMRPKPHRELTDFLDKSERRTSLILMPRGSFKSSVVTVAHSIQQMIKNPNITILVSSETQGNAIKFVGEVKAHVEGNPKLRALYGNWVNRGNTWKANEFIINKRTRPTKEATITAGSLEKGTQVGMHYDLIILDDVVSSQNISTEDQIQKTIDHYKLLLSILNPGGKILVVGTRWGFYELYSWLQDPEGPEYKQVDTFYRAAEDDDGNLLMPEILSREFLDQQKLTQGSYIYSCNPKETPVLLSDFKTKRIDEIKVGDELVGFELPNSDNERTKLKKTVVEEVNSRMAETWEYTFRSGHIIRCTPDHQWYKRPSDKYGRKAYSPIEMNSRLKRVVDLNYKPTKENLLDYQYLAGIIDGEGAVGHGSMTITQSIGHNPRVCKKIEYTLERLKLPFVKNITQAGMMANYVIGGGRDIKWRVLEFGKPAKANQIIKTIWDHPGRLVGGVRSYSDSRDQIVSMRPYKKEKVYALKTTTGNYVAWGYASKNCQYLNKPQSSSINIFKEHQIQYYEKAPDGLIFFITVDPAISLKARSDFSGIIVNGVDYHGNWYIREALELKLEPAGLIAKLFELVDTYQPMMCLAMEKFALEKVLKLNIDAEMIKRNTSFAMKDLPTNTRISKEARIRALQPMFEGKRVYIKKEHKALFQQLVYFPQVKHDDVLDALKSQLQIVFSSDVKPSGGDLGPTLSRNEQRQWDDLAKRFPKDKIRQVKRYYDD